MVRDYVAINCRQTAQYLLKTLKFFKLHPYWDQQWHAEGVRVGATAPGIQPGGIQRGREFSEKV